MKMTPRRTTVTPTSTPSDSGAYNSANAAVLVDGSALYFSSRGLYEGLQLDYRALITVLSEKVPGLESSLSTRPHTRWVMWTSASPQNPGQTRFLDFAEKDLRWEVRRFSPIDSYVVDPSTALSVSSDSRTATRLVRFDASIAFAMGRLASDHRIVVVSDSFALADSLHRLTQISDYPTRRPTLAFFGRALDPRWSRPIRNSQGPFDFIDLDDSAVELFGSQAAGIAPSTKKGDSMIF